MTHQPYRAGRTPHRTAWKRHSPRLFFGFLGTLWPVIFLTSVPVRLSAAPSALVTFQQESATDAERENEVSADSIAQEGVPQGQIQGPFPFASNIFPGTQRNYWVYVPANYDPEKTYCLLVVQDGLGRAEEWRLTTVMDNLIHQQQMPPTIGLFVDHGIVPAPNDQSQARFNRSFEYDAVGDRYARFLIDELLPEVKRNFNFSDDPNDRAIAGASSGGICAFNVAWERPDAFRRVLCTIGTFVGLRGGNEFPTLVRKFEAKPIRVFLQDGNQDLNIYAGDWWMANQSMLSALQWSGYSVRHAWGSGGHNGKHGAAILPDALRWLWQDYPQKVTVDPTRSAGRRMDLLIPDQTWETVAQSKTEIACLVPDQNGDLWFAADDHKIYRVDGGGQISPWAQVDSPVYDLHFSGEGKLHAATGQGVIQIDPARKINAVSPQVLQQILMLADGACYGIDAQHQLHSGTSWQTLRPNPRDPQAVVAEASQASGDLWQATHMVASPDQTLLWVSDPHSAFVHSYQRSAIPDLYFGQAYGDLHTPHGLSRSGARSMAVDTEGRVYVPSAIGIQVLDQLGRVNLILLNPQSQAANDICLGGEAKDTLYVSCGKQIFRRRIRASGAWNWQAPTKPPQPGL